MPGDLGMTLGEGARAIGMSAGRARARTGHVFRFDRHELGGGLGDAGLFVPLAVALVAVNGLNATAVFAGAGLVYLATALYFRVPVPVQPLKAFGAAAIALKLEADVIAAGAILMAAAMALLAATGLAGWLAERFPLVLVRGIQASVALLLCKAAVELAYKGNWEGLPAVSSNVSMAFAAAACAVLFLLRDRSVPGTLLVIAAGAGTGLAVAGSLPHAGFGPQPVGLSVPDGAAFATARTALVIAQLPLTFGNSVVATADAERVYFGRRAARVRPNRLAGSIGAANLLAGLTHGLPLCHGAGGVTAHVKLGARTAGATVTVGLLYLTLALAFGASLPAVLRLLVPGALAGMLLFVAIQHGILAAQLDRLADRTLAAGVGLVTLVSGNLAIGFGAGAAVLLARWAVSMLWAELSARDLPAARY
jgi:sulfate permease, SulP family